MSPESENSFLDTNILVYAYDNTAEEKHQVARKIVLDCMKGNTSLTVSNQILGETANTILKKQPNISKKEMQELIEDILQNPFWIKINYTGKTILNAFTLLEPGDDFWDLVIAQTMLENGITKIYTENTKDFEKIKGIKAVNPFTEKS